MQNYTPEMEKAAAATIRRLADIVAGKVVPKAVRKKGLNIHPTEFSRATENDHLFRLRDIFGKDTADASERAGRALNNLINNPYLREAERLSFKSESPFTPFYRHFPGAENASAKIWSARLP